MDIIHCYSRAQALSDGVLIDVTETAQDAGFRYPTAITRAVWEHYVRVPEGLAGQDETGRLWDILMMLRYAILAEPNDALTSEIRFQLYVRNDDEKLGLVTLKAICGPGDGFEPVITVMLPCED